MGINNSIIKASLSGFTVAADTLLKGIMRDINSGWTDGMLSELEKLIGEMTMAHQSDCEKVDDLLGGVKEGLNRINREFGAVSSVAKIKAEISLLEKANIELQAQKRRQKFDEAVKGLQNRMVLKRYSSGSETVDELRVQEIRRLLQGKESTWIYTRFMEACRNLNDYLLVRAIEEAPEIARLLDEDHIEKGKIERMKREYKFESAEIELISMQKRERALLFGRGESILQELGWSNEAKRFLEKALKEKSGAAIQSAAA